MNNILQKHPITQFFDFPFFFYIPNQTGGFYPGDFGTKLKKVVHKEHCLGL